MYRITVTKYTRTCGVPDTRLSAEGIGMKETDVVSSVSLVRELQPKGHLFLQLYAVKACLVESGRI